MAFPQDIEVAMRLLGKRALEPETKRNLLTAKAKKESENYNQDEWKRKGYEAQYKRFITEDIANEKNVFSRLIDRTQEKLKEEAAKAAQYLNDYSQR